MLQWYVTSPTWLEQAVLPQLTGTAVSSLAGGGLALPKNQNLLALTASRGMSPLLPHSPVAPLGWGLPRQELLGKRNPLRVLGSITCIYKGRGWVKCKSAYTLAGRRGSEKWLGKRGGSGGSGCGGTFGGSCSAVAETPDCFVPLWLQVPGGGCPPSPPPPFYLSVISDSAKKNRKKKKEMGAMGLGNGGFIAHPCSLLSLA